LAVDIVVSDLNELGLRVMVGLLPQEVN